MFSRILLKLIDQAIIPALLVVTTRIVSIILLCHYFKIDFVINKNGLIFSNPQAYMFVNSYSLLAIIFTVSLGMVITITNSILFHHENIKPHMTAKLFSLKMHSLIKNSFEIYTKATIWISYLWLLTFTTGILMYLNTIYPFIFYISVVFTATFTVLLLMDVERKTKISKDTDFIFDMDRKFLEKNN